MKFKCNVMKTKCNVMKFECNVVTFRFNLMRHKSSVVTNELKNCWTRDSMPGVRCDQRDSLTEDHIS